MPIAVETPCMASLHAWRLYNNSGFYSLFTLLALAILCPRVAIIPHFFAQSQQSKQRKRQRPCLFFSLLS